VRGRGRGVGLALRGGRLCCGGGGRLGGLEPAGVCGVCVCVWYVYACVRACVCAVCVRACVRYACACVRVYVVCVCACVWYAIMRARTPTCVRCTGPLYHRCSFPRIKSRYRLLCAILAHVPSLFTSIPALFFSKDQGPTSVASRTWTRHKAPCSSSTLVKGSYMPVETTDAAASLHSISLLYSVSPPACTALRASNVQLSRFDRVIKQPMRATVMPVL
jgi:hypothetical protein